MLPLLRWRCLLRHLPRWKRSSNGCRSNARVSAADPVEDHLRELLWLVLVGEVSTTLEHSKPTAGEAVIESMAVVLQQEHVEIPPEELDG